MNELYDFLIQFVAVGGGAATIAYVLFTWLSKKWLENKFAERLEDYKRRQSQELEHYRYEINALFNRITKIHEKEFEVLPEAWKKLQDTLGHVAALTSPVQSYPDFKWMTSEQLEEFLDKSDLDDSDKKKIRESEDKNKTYQELIFWYKARKATLASQELHNYLLYNKIFLTKDLFDRFTKIDNMMADILDEWQYRRQKDRPLPTMETFTKIREQALEVVKEIEQLAQERLHYLEA